MDFMKLNFQRSSDESIKKPYLSINAMINSITSLIILGIYNESKRAPFEL